MPWLANFKRIEFAIYTVDEEKEIVPGGDLGNLNHLPGKEWRAVKKLVAECEEGLHPKVSLIERLEKWYYDPEFFQMGDCVETELYCHPRYKEEP